MSKKLLFTHVPIELKERLMSLTAKLGGEVLGVDHIQFDQETTHVVASSDDASPTERILGALAAGISFKKI